MYDVLSTVNDGDTGWPRGHTGHKARSAVELSTKRARPGKNKLGA